MDPKDKGSGADDAVCGSMEELCGHLMRLLHVLSRAWRGEEKRKILIEQMETAVDDFIMLIQRRCMEVTLEQVVRIPMLASVDNMRYYQQYYSEHSIILHSISHKLELLEDIGNACLRTTECKRH